MLPFRRIVIPTPYGVGPVNVYLILSRPYALIDTGPNTPEAREALKKGLGEAGVALSEIERVILTHSHEDHSGLSHWLHENSGAKVYLHHFELQKLLGLDGFFWHMVPVIKDMGTPQELLDLMIKERDEFFRSTVSKDYTVELKGGEELPFEDGVLQVYHLPGHSPGHLCYFDPVGGSFFAGDVLLTEITPNPVVEFNPESPGERYPSLRTFLEGLDKIDKLDIKVGCPAHGELIQDCHALINVYREHHRNRLNLVLDILRKSGKEMTVYEVSEGLFPGLKGFEVFLGLSEAQVHLDLLVERGQVKVRKGEEVSYYSLV